MHRKASSSKEMGSQTDFATGEERVRMEHVDALSLRSVSLLSKAIGVLPLRSPYEYSGRRRERKHLALGQYEGIDRRLCMNGKAKEYVLEGFQLHVIYHLHDVGKALKKVPFR